ncbi:MAG: hypothetical protein HY301_18755 [Verrucomicrobia bacterium]|nr:hypothetical protein [Verrucomicrobiota bacterium]
MQFHYPYKANKARLVRSGLNDINRLALIRGNPTATILVASKEQLRDGGGSFTLGLGNAYNPLVEANQFQGVGVTIHLETDGRKQFAGAPCLIPLQDLNRVRGAINDESDTIFIPWTTGELENYLKEFPRSVELPFNEEEFDHVDRS